MQKNYQQQFYHSQNIDLRKEIRQLDFRLAQGDTNFSQCNFIVVGPPKVGKTSLIKTLQFALNGSQGWGTYQKAHVSGVEIKKGAKWMVEGVKELREMNQKFGIQGLQLISQDKPSTRYKRALEYVAGSLGQCFVESSELELKTKCKVCLIAFNSEKDIPSDELTYLKFLRVDMMERGVKTFLVLIGNFDRNNANWKQTQARITSLHQQFQIKRDDVICMDTYHFDGQKSINKLILKQSQLTSTKIENNEEINFYALQLLLKIIRESQRNVKNRGVKPKGWLCNWT